MTNSTFATSINCIDGRVQEPVLDWIKKNYKVDFVDNITDPGDDRTLSHFNFKTINSIKHKVEISVSAHGSKLLFIVGHHDCAANPVSKNEHFEEIKKSVDTAKKWGFAILVKGLWVNENWEVEKVC